MLKPEISKIRIDTFLSNYGIAYKNGAFIADILAPIVKVKTLTGIYYTFGFESFYIEDDLMRPGTAANEIRWDCDTETFRCEQRGFKKGLSLLMHTQEDSPVQLKARTIEKLKNKLSLSREKRVRDIFYISGGFTKSGVLAADAKWDNYAGANSEPLIHILAGKNHIRKQTLKEATHIVIPACVSEYLMNHPDILELQKYTHSDLLTKSGLPSIIRGLKVIEPNVHYGDSEGALAADMTSLWGDNVIICYINSKPALDTINTVQTFAMREGRARKWYEEEIETNFYEYSTILGEKVISTGGAYIIEGVLS